ncbi:MAG: hypothetical protein EZS28_028138, partial [Streblomastix strix]
PRALISALHHEMCLQHRNETGFYPEKTYIAFSFFAHNPYQPIPAEKIPKDGRLISGITMHGFAWDFVKKEIIDVKPFGNLPDTATQFPIMHMTLMRKDISAHILQDKYFFSPHFAPFDIFHTIYFNNFMQNTNNSQLINKRFFSGQKEDEVIRQEENKFSYFQSENIKVGTVNNTNSLELKFDMDNQRNESQLQQNDETGTILSGRHNQPSKQSNSQTTKPISHISRQLSIQSSKDNNTFISRPIPGARQRHERIQSNKIIRSEEQQANFTDMRLIPTNIIQKRQYFKTSIYTSAYKDEALCDAVILQHRYGKWDALGAYLFLDYDTQSMEYIWLKQYNGNQSQL